LKKLAPSKTLLLRRVVEAFRLVAVLLLLLAMLRPQTGRTQSRVVTEGIDIMLAIDTSGRCAPSTSTPCADPDARNRLQVVTAVVEDFIKKRDKRPDRHGGLR